MVWGKTPCCGGKAPQQHVPGAAAAALLLSQRRGRQVQLEVLVLEDAAGGRVPVGNTEQPVLVTAAVAPTRQLRQESQLQGKPPVTLGTLLRGTQSPGRHRVPAAVRETLPQVKPRARMARRDPTELRAGHHS